VDVQFAQLDRVDDVAVEPDPLEVLPEGIAVVERDGHLAGLGFGVRQERRLTARRGPRAAIADLPPPLRFGGLGRLEGVLRQRCLLAGPRCRGSIFAERHMPDPVVASAIWRMQEDCKPADSVRSLIEGRNSETSSGAAE